MCFKGNHDGVTESLQIKLLSIKKKDCSSLQITLQNMTPTHFIKQLSTRWKAQRKNLEMDEGILKSSENCNKAL